MRETRKIYWNPTRFLKYVFVLLFIILLSSSLLFAQSQYGSQIKIEKKLSLEDPIGLMPVSITNDGKGNFIATYGQTHKVSVYNPEGDLLFNYGREGKGPGDFLYPMYTIRLSNGQLLTAEAQGKLSLYNSTGDSLIKIYNIQITPLTEIHEIDESSILLVGRRMIDRKFKYLHILDMKSGTIQKSFFEPSFSLNEDYGGALTTIFNLATATVNNGKIAAAFGPFSKISIYNSKGNLENTTPFSLKHFKTIEDIGNSNSLAGHRYDKFLTTFSLIDKIFWHDDDTFYIRFYRFTEFSREDDIRELQYSLANIKQDGTLIFDIESTPKIKSLYKSILYFENTDFESKEQLLVGSIEN